MIRMNLPRAGTFLYCPLGLCLLAPAASAQTVTLPVTVTASPLDESLVTPAAEEARRRIEKTPGGVDIMPVVPQAYHVDNANTLKTEPYALLGAKAGYDFGNGVKLFAEGRNLLDRTFISNVSTTTIASASAALFNPGEGRAVYGGIEVRW